MKNAVVALLISLVGVSSQAVTITCEYGELGAKPAKKAVSVADLKYDSSNGFLFKHDDLNYYISLADMYQDNLNRINPIFEDAMSIVEMEAGGTGSRSAISDGAYALFQTDSVLIQCKKTK